MMMMMMRRRRRRRRRKTGWVHRKSRTPKTFKSDIILRVNLVMLLNFVQDIFEYMSYLE
jgi:hypothetical protein